jgi:hypothetical protein
MTMQWMCLYPRAEELLGFLPGMLSDDDQRPAREQFDENYQHGGGWQPLDSCRAVAGEPFSYGYPGDPPQRPRICTVLRDEVICVYEYGFVGIWQKDGSFEIARMD